MHIASGDYIPFTGTYLKGRGFYQPVESLTIADLYPYGVPSSLNPTDPISKLFAPGIEYFFDSSSTEASKLYAMFDGFINWTDNRLVLTPELKVANELAKHAMLEAPLGRIIYDNVDKASLKLAITDLIINSLSSAPQHPILNVGVSIGWLGPSGFGTIKQFLQSSGMSPSMAIINYIIDILFFQYDCKLQVLAGDLLGQADLFTATDELPPTADQPAWFKTIADDDRARRIHIITKDAGKQVLNPWYYIFQYNASANVTPITYRKEFHPLLQNIAAPAYGKAIMGTTYYIPLGDLNTWHGFPGNDPDIPDTFTVRSKYEWRYDDNGLFEVDTHITDAAGNPVPFRIPAGKREKAKLASMKGLYAALLNNYCEKMQLPVELMMGIAGAESTGKTPADVRLEPLKNENERALAGTTLFHQYNKLTGFHCKAAYVIKEKDDFKFLVEKNEDIKAITIKTDLNVDVPMRLYYDTDKYWLIRKEGSNVGNTIEIKAKDVYKTGFTGKQPFGTELFYRINKVDVSKTALADVEFTMLKAGYLQLDMKTTDKLFKKKPTLNGDVTITVYVNGSPSDLTFVIPQGDQTIKDVNVLETNVAIAPGDKVGLGVDTDGTTGEIEGLGLRFKLISIWVKIPKADNTKPAHADYADIKALPSGMAAAGTMAAGTTLYHAIGTPAAGVSTIKTVTTYKAPADGFLLLADLNATSNTLKNSTTVKILRKTATGFEPTGISSIVLAKTTKITQPSSCDKVKKDEQFILEITTPAAAKPPATPAEQLGGLTMQVYFIPFNDDESFITSRNGYSFDLLKFNRTVKTDPIHRENGRTMTWNDLDEWIRKTKGDRISVGPLQTLIATAHNTVKSVNVLINLMIPFTAPTDLALYLDYLSDPVKALAIAAALIRKQYNFLPDSTNQNQSTQFDLPLVGGVHNAQRKKGRIRGSKNNWGLVFAKADEYITNSAPMFNLAQQNYRQPNFFIPTVQFKK